jgi:hypothetical protein
MCDGNVGGDLQLNRAEIFRDLTERKGGVDEMQRVFSPTMGRRKMGERPSPVGGSQGGEGKRKTVMDDR